MIGTATRAAQGQAEGENRDKDRDKGIDRNSYKGSTGTG